MGFEVKTRDMSPLLTVGVGEVVQGFLTGFASIETATGYSEIVHITLTKSGTYGVWDKESDNIVPTLFKKNDKISLFHTVGMNLEAEDVGYEIRLTYEGKKVNPKTKREYHSYVTEIDRSSNQPL